MSLSGSGSVTPSNHQAAATLSGEGILVVSSAEVASAVDELRVIRQPDVEKLTALPSAEWTKREVVWAALIVILAVYLALPSSAQQQLLNAANLAQGVEAVAALLKP